jgi:hypothetical protein
MRVLRGTDQVVINVFLQFRTIRTCSSPCPALTTPTVPTVDRVDSPWRPSSPPEVRP